MKKCAVPSIRLLILVAAISLCSGNIVLAQDVTISNLNQLAQEAFSDSIYIPFAPWDWRAYSLNGGEPWWVDCSGLPCEDLLSSSTNFSAHGVGIVPARLTENVLTGETLMQSEWATDVVARVAAPNGYQPGQLSYRDGMMWRMWQQATNCPDCWGIEGGFPPPIVEMKVLLADVNDYATYESNLEAEAEAEASSESSVAMGRMFTMSEEDDFEMDSLSCTSTGVLGILSVTIDTNGWTTLVWGPTSTNYLYEVQAAATLSNTTSWFVAHTMVGNCGTSSWTDKAAPQQPQFFWRIQQLNFNDDADGDGLSNIQEFDLGTNLHNTDTDGDGMPDGWEVAHGLNPLDSGDAVLDPDGDGLNNLQEYLNGTDPHHYDTLLDFVVNGGQLYSPSLTVPIQSLSTNYPKVRVSLDPVMTNATIVANSGSFTYTLPDNGDGQYDLYLQYADTNGLANSIAVTKMVIVDRVSPVVYISSPASNAVLDQAFITLQAVAYDPDPVGLQGLRPLKIWLNGQPFWDRAGTNVVVERFPVPAGTNSFTVTIQVVDEVAHTNQATRTWTVNTSGDTTAPHLSTFNIATNMLLPDVAAIWVEATVDDSNALVSAVANSNAGSLTTNALNVSGGRTEGLIPLDSGTNQVVIYTWDAAGNKTSNVFTAVRSSRYQAAITNPVFGVFALAPSNHVGGYVSAVFDMGLPTQTNVTSVLINGVPAVLGTNIDSNGNVSFITTNWIPLGQQINGQLIGGGLPSNPAPSIPPAQSQVYEVTHKDDVYDYSSVIDSGVFDFSRVKGASCWSNNLQRQLSSQSEDMIDGTATEQGIGTNKSDRAPACLAQIPADPDSILWQTLSSGPFSYSFVTGPIDRALNFGFDCTAGRNQGGNTSPAIVSGPCCCHGAFDGPVDCTVPDITNDELCHGYPRTDCSGFSVQDCLTWDHWVTTLTEGAALNWTRQNAALTFRSPREYGSNTTVLFTFEGMGYYQHVPIDLSQVKFRGQLPVVYSNQTKTASYLLTVDGGKKYTLNQDDFDWPFITQTNPISSTVLNTNCFPYANKDVWVFGSTTEQSRALSWTNFHNQPEPMEVITGNYNGNDWAAVWNKLALPSPQVSAKNQTVFVAGRTKVADYIAQSTPTNGVTGIRYGSAINGNFFNSGSDCSEIVGFVGTGSPPWSCGNSNEFISNAGLRWGFGISAVQSLHVIDHDVEQSGGYYPGAVIKQMPYGLNNLGALILSGVSQAADTTWPFYNSSRCRSLLVWSRDQHHMFMIIVGYSATNNGFDWNDTITFIKGGFRDELRKRPELRDFEFGDAIMLDGGTSSQVSFRRVVRDGVGSIQVQQQDIVDVYEIAGIGGTVRQVPTMVNTYATIP